MIDTIQEIGVVFGNRMYRIVIELDAAKPLATSVKGGLTFVQLANFIYNFSTRKIIKGRMYEEEVLKQVDESDLLITILKCQELQTLRTVAEEEAKHGYKDLLHWNWK